MNVVRRLATLFGIAILIAAVMLAADLMIRVGVINLSDQVKAASPDDEMRSRLMELNLFSVLCYQIAYLLIALAVSAWFGVRGAAIMAMLLLGGHMLWPMWRRFQIGNPLAPIGMWQESVAYLTAIGCGAGGGLALRYRRHPRQHS